MLMGGALWGVAAPPGGQTLSAVARIRERAIGNITACVVVVRRCRINVGVLACIMRVPIAASVSAGTNVRGQARGA